MKNEAELILIQACILMECDPDNLSERIMEMRQEMGRLKGQILLARDLREPAKLLIDLQKGRIEELEGAIGQAIDEAFRLNAPEIYLNLEHVMEKLCKKDV